MWRNPPGGLVRLRADRRRIVTTVAIIGGGWAGLAAAVSATEAGARVTVFEAARHWGGRARAVAGPEGETLDNGQHILIGAYGATLGLMQRLGVDLQQALLALPLALPFADGGGLRTPAWAARWPAPWDALAAMATTAGWSVSERAGLVAASLRWRLGGFRCEPDRSVADLCAALPPRVRDELIEPLCVSALNTPLAQASGAVFLRVLRDALFGAGHAPWKASTLLLPRQDLSELLPAPAARWLNTHGADLRPGQRVMTLQPHAPGWSVDGERFDTVVLAASSVECARLAEPLAPHWAQQARALRFQAITTVYAQGPSSLRLLHPMLALRPGPAAPAQFVFDRGQLGGPAGQLALVVSASQGERELLQQQALAQTERTLGLGGLKALTTVVEKRATFACTPALQRPGAQIASGLWAAADFVDGPYPATLEGAVRSGLAAGRAALQG